MIPNNYYPVKYKDFLRIKSTGNYVISYALLDDRIHFEMPVENAVYVTQRFLHNVKEEIEQKAQNYSDDPIKLFLRMTLEGSTFYRFYPTSQQIVEIKKIKLYDKIVITESKPGVYNRDDLKIFETDTYMRATDGDEVVLFGEKQ